MNYNQSTGNFSSNYYNQPYTDPTYSYYTDQSSGNYQQPINTHQPPQQNAYSYSSANTIAPKNTATSTTVQQYTTVTNSAQTSSNVPAYNPMSGYDLLNPNLFENYHKSLTDTNAQTSAYLIFPSNWLSKNESVTKPKETVQEKSRLTNSQAGSGQTKKQPVNENSNRKEEEPSEKTRNQKDALECEFEIARQLSCIRKDHLNSEERILKTLLAQDDFILRHTKQIEELRKSLICKTTKLSNIEEDFKNQINLQEAVSNMSQKHKDDKLRRLECELESKSHDIQELIEKFDALTKEVDQVKERVKAIFDLGHESSSYVMVEEVEDEAQDALSKSLLQDRDTAISLLLLSVCFAAGHFIVFDIKPFLGGNNSINILLASMIWPITFFVISTSFGILVAEYKDKKVDSSTRDNESASTKKPE